MSVLGVSLGHLDDLLLSPLDPWERTSSPTRRKARRPPRRGGVPLHLAICRPSSSSTTLARNTSLQECSDDRLRHVRFGSKADAGVMSASCPLSPQKRT